MKYKIITTFEEVNSNSIEYYIAYELDYILGGEQVVDVKSAVYSPKDMCKYIAFRYKDVIIETKISESEPLDIEVLANQLKEKQEKHEVFAKMVKSNERTNGNV